MRARAYLALAVAATATVWTVVGPVPVRPLYVLLGGLGLAYLGSVVHPGAVLVMASLMLPPSLAALGLALLQPQPPDSWARLTALRLLIVFTSIGFTLTRARTPSRL
jgi:hypothetical protein